MCKELFVGCVGLYVGYDGLHVVIRCNTFVLGFV